MASYTVVCDYDKKADKWICCVSDDEKTLATYEGTGPFTESHVDSWSEAYKAAAYAGIDNVAWCDHDREYIHFGDGKPEPDDE